MPKRARSDDLIEELKQANRRTAQAYPGDPGKRQPVHTVYGGADRFKPDTVRRLGSLALRSLEMYAPTAATLAEALGVDVGRTEAIYAKVVEKLERDPVEDFRLDFEDGYGHRPPSEEDGHAESAAAAIAAGLAGGTLPPFVGIRVKPLNDLAPRSFRTLDLFLSRLIEETAGSLPANFVVTLPKPTSAEQVAALSEYLNRLETVLGLPHGSVVTEIMIETTQAVFDREGRANVRRLVEAGQGRVRGAHFGTYDYTAACDITAAYQTMTHPACDFAKAVMQVALAGTGLWMSDGSTNVLPVPLHRHVSLRATQEAENRAAVHAAWRLHFSHVRHSLLHGFYQGWDLHPAQLVTRYAAVFDFFAEGLEDAAARLRNFIEQAAKATLVGEVFDDAATGQGLVNFFLRALNAGALSEEEATQRSSLTLDELRTRSFPAIVEGRQLAQ